MTPKIVHPRVMPTGPINSALAAVQRNVEFQRPQTAPGVFINHTTRGVHVRARAQAVTQVTQESSNDWRWA